MRIPEALRREWRREPRWLEALPRLAAECAELWDLELEEPFATPRSLVVPSGDAVLKLNAPAHLEAEREADALALWNGNGAVRLLARDDARRALLIERCRPGTPLSGSGSDEVEVVLGLLARLDAAPRRPHPFRLVADEAECWAEEVERRYRVAGEPFERSLLARALDVFRSADRSASRLVNQDVHAGNVLRAQREPWLVVDPKPLVGEPELDAVGLLRNAAWAAAPGEAVARWLDALRTVGLDRARLVGWGLAHALAWGWDEERGWDPRHVAAARTIARS